MIAAQSRWRRSFGRARVRSVGILLRRPDDMLRARRLKVDFTGVVCEDEEIGTHIIRRAMRRLQRWLAKRSGIIRLTMYVTEVRYTRRKPKRPYMTRVKHVVGVELVEAGGSGHHVHLHGDGRFIFPTLPADISFAEVHHALNVEMCRLWEDCIRAEIAKIQTSYEIRTGWECKERHRHGLPVLIHPYKSKPGDDLEEWEARREYVIGGHRGDKNRRPKARGKMWWRIGPFKLRKKSKKKKSDPVATQGRTSGGGEYKYIRSLVGRVYSFPVPVPVPPPPPPPSKHMRRPVPAAYPERRSRSPPGRRPCQSLPAVRAEVRPVSFQKCRRSQKGSG